MGQRCLDYKLAKEWNKLPSNMKTISNSKLFQSKLKTFLLNKDTLNLQELYSIDIIECLARVAHFAFVDVLLGFFFH